MNPSRIAHMVANTLRFYFVADINISYILLMGKSIHQCCSNQGHNREIHLGLTTFSQIMTKLWIRMRSILRLTHSKMIPFNTQMCKMGKCCLNIVYVMFVLSSWSKGNFIGTTNYNDNGRSFPSRPQPVSSSRWCILPINQRRPQGTVLGRDIPAISRLYSSNSASMLCPSHCTWCGDLHLTLEKSRNYWRLQT